MKISEEGRGSEENLGDERRGWCWKEKGIGVWIHGGWKAAGARFEDQELGICVRRESGIDGKRSSRKGVSRVGRKLGCDHVPCEC